MIGQSLARYTIESQLGAGGMGVVYKARDTQLDRIVAIKVLPPDKVADPDRKRRFIREAKAASALNHPGIVTVHDIGSDAGRDFIVMEYLQGATLDRLVPAGGLKVKQALGYAAAIADALAKAHEAGILHRDLKPSNILVTEDGRVKVLDFGLAKLLEPSETSPSMTTVVHTEAGSVVGTTAYMSPEQAEGRKLDARSDIFSFGSLLYEMLTGHKAFAGDSRLSILAKIAGEEPTPPTRLAPGLSAEVEKTVLRCLRKDPARRYQTMADLKVALDDLIDDSSATPAPAPTPVRSRGGRRWAITAVAAAGLIAAGYTVMQLRPPAPDTPLHAVPLTSLPGLVRQPSLSPDGDHVAFVWTGPGHDNPDVYVQQIGAGTPLRLTTDPANDHSPSWSPDGKAIAFLRRHGDAAARELRLIAPLGGSERKLSDISVRTLYRPLTLAWCPDSSCVVVTDQQGADKPPALFAMPLNGTERHQLTFPPDNAVVDADPAIAHDGRTLVFRRDFTPFTGGLYRQPLSANSTPAGDAVQLTDYRISGTRPAWLPDGRSIVFAAQGGLWRINVFDGTPPSRLPYVGIDGSAPTLSRSSSAGDSRLVYARAVFDTNIWRLDTDAAGEPAATPPRRAIASTRADTMPNLSPDGTRLAFFSGRSGEFELWVADPDGANAMQLTSLNAVPGFARWSPDGQTLAFHSDPEGRPDVLLVPANGGSFRILTKGTLGGGFPSFSQDGQTVYYSGPAAPGILRGMRIPVGGGTAVPHTPITTALTLESPDRRYWYFAEAGERPSALWRLPAGGGTPEKLFDGVIDSSFDVIESGIYFIDRVSPEGITLVAPTQNQRRLRFYDFATRRLATVAENLGTVSAGITVSRDGRTIFFARIDSSTDELMLVDRFR